MNAAAVLAAAAAAASVGLVGAVRPSGVASRLVTGRRPGADSRAAGRAAGCAAGRAAGRTIGRTAGLRAAAGWRRVVDRLGRRRLARRNQQLVIEALAILTADLRAGRPISTALEAAAESCPLLVAAARSAELGGDPPELIETAAAAPGAQGLRALAAAWRVAEHSGVALAEVLDRLNQALRARQSAQRQVAAGLGGTRATARLLAVLPVVPLGLGELTGARPLALLVGSLAGWSCLVGGLLLAVAGLWWVDRITAGCEDREAVASRC